jgi:hypothetical protein
MPSELTTMATSSANLPPAPILPVSYFPASQATLSFTTINQPAGVTADTINAQGINNNGRVVGFYLGNDGQVHGFTANTPAAPGAPSPGPPLPTQ